MPDFDYRGVCRFFTPKDTKFELLKSMKLVYIAHGFFLATSVKSFVGKDQFQAWPYGPVLPDLYRAYKDNPAFLETVSEISDGPERTLLDKVCSIYGEVSAYDLVALTHKIGSPWYESYERGFNVIISDESIKVHYESLIETYYKDEFKG